MAVVKVIEVVGTSMESWDDAVKNGLEGAKKTLHGIRGLEIVSQTATVREGAIEEYRSTIKVAFKVD